MTTIQHVIDELDVIIDACEKKESRQAYFAVLYKGMTEAVRNGIQQGIFEDGSRMERLDVIFAKRYISAWHCYQQKQPCSSSWQTAFDACDNSTLVVLQHLILGINTHINLDLAIAAAETCPGQDIFLLQTDFERINSIIAALTNDMQARLEKIWWPMRFLRNIVNGREKTVINFSITNARKASWANAVALAVAEGNAEAHYVKGIDNIVNRGANGIIQPGFFIGLLLAPVRWFENKDVRKVIALLK